MKIHSKLIANYSQTGHPEYREDTWSSEKEVANSKELLKAMKKWFKSSASSFNDYPFSGLFSTSLISFTKQDYVTIEGVKYYADEQDIDLPDFFEDTVNEFNEWEKNIRDRLPRLRKAQEKSDIEKRERALYEGLNIKYGS